MTGEPLDMTATIAPRSDQLNAEDLLTGPVTVTITDVTRGSAEQPVNIVTAEFGPGRPYKPSKTMRRLIVAAWGKDSSVYVGRRLTIYRDPDVMFGKDRVGGIKISHLSHLAKRLEIALTVTRGRRAQFTADPLPDAPPATRAAAGKPPAAGKAPTAGGIVNGFKALGVSLAQLEARVKSPTDQWTSADISSLAALGSAIKAGETTTFEEFEPEQQALAGESETVGPEENS